MLGSVALREPQDENGSKTIPKAVAIARGSLYKITKRLEIRVLVAFLETVIKD